MSVELIAAEKSEKITEYPIIVIFPKEHIMFISSSKQGFLIRNKVSNCISIDVNCSSSDICIKYFLKKENVALIEFKSTIFLRNSKNDLKTLALSRK